MRRHQQRVLAVVRSLGAEVEPEFALPQASRFVDGLVIVDHASEGWGLIAADVARRLVVVEHFAKAPSLPAMLRAMAKHAWLVDEWHQPHGPDTRWRRAGHEANPPRPPLLLIVAGGTPQAALCQLPALRPRSPGIWCAPAPTGGRILATPRAMAAESPGTSVLRLMLTPRGTEAGTHIRGLLTDPTLLQSTVERLLENLMDNTIPSTDEEQESIVARLRREGRQDGRKQELVDLARQHGGDAAVEELSAIDDLDTLRRRVLELIAGSGSAAP